MTDEETRQLDAWIAEHVFGWVWVCDYKWDDFDRTKPYRQLVNPRHLVPERCEMADGSEEWGWLGGALPEFYGVPRYTAPYAGLLRSVKGVIERRGWSWSCAAFMEGKPKFYRFSVFTERLDLKISADAGTEELAGCLALKAAVEATESKATALGDTHVATVKHGERGDYVVGVDPAGEDGDVSVKLLVKRDERGDQVIGNVMKGTGGDAEDSD